MTLQELANDLKRELNANNPDSTIFSIRSYLDDLITSLENMNPVEFRSVILNYNTPGWISPATLANVFPLVEGEVVITCGVIILTDFIGTDDPSSDEIVILAGDGGQLNTGGIAPQGGNNGSFKLSVSLMHGDVSSVWPQYATDSAASLSVQYAVGTGVTHPTAGSALIWVLVGTTT